MDAKAGGAGFDEWLERQEKLFAMGGPCDAPTWDEYQAWEAQQPKQRR